MLSISTEYFSSSNLFTFAGSKIKKKIQIANRFQYSFRLIRQESETWTNRRIENYTNGVSVFATDYSMCG